MHAKSTRFATDIVAEVYEPKKLSNKVVIFAPGMPGMPGNKDMLASFFNKKGYWFINPRYRGSWESGGHFLDEEPTKDVIDIIDTLVNGSFQILPDGMQMSISDAEIFIVGLSFGGPAAIAASIDSRVKKVVSISGLVDWSVLGEDEPFEWLFEDFMPQVFGAGYRFKKSEDWKKLIKTFYNPVQYDTVQASKILAIHSEDDTVVPYVTVQSFCERHSIPLITLKGMGHAGSSSMMKRKVWKQVKKHFEK